MLDKIHHPSSISLPLSTPTKIMRKLSHSKIIGHHLPHLITKGDPIHQERGRGGGDEEEPSENPPQMKRIEKDFTTKLKGLPGGKYLGLVLALMASLTMSLMTLVVKSMPQYHAFSLVLWRLQGVLLPSIFLLTYLGTGKNQNKAVFEGVWPAKWKILCLLVARGIFGCSADVFQYCSLKYLSLADSSVIAFSTPIFVTFVAYFVLREKIGIVPVFTGILSLVGVVIISRPPMLTGEESFDTDILIGNALALGCMTMSTFTFIILRTLRSVHFSLTTFSFGFIGSMEAILLCGVTATFEVPQGVHDWVLVLTIAFMYFVGQIFITLALQLEDAGPVALVRSCDVIFAYVWQYLFLDTVPDLFSVVGGAIVISGVVITAFRKFLLELPQEDVKRKSILLEPSRKSCPNPEEDARLRISENNIHPNKWDMFKVLGGMDHNF